MDIEILKDLIVEKKIKNQFMIFVFDDNDFLPLQYFHEICLINKMQPQRIEQINDLIKCSFSLFGNIKSDVYNVYFCDEFNECIEAIKKLDNLCVICKKVSQQANIFYSEYITTFPKLEAWQVKDYAYSVLQSVDPSLIELFIKKCENNIFKIDNELKKITCFDSNERKYVFENFMNDNLFSHISEYRVFDFTNAILNKDLKKVFDIYKNKESIDLEPMGILTILYNNFRNIIKIQLTANSTPENTGIPQKQFWAIKYNCNHYSKTELIKVFDLLCSIDKKIKTGILSTDCLIDYLLVHILSIGG